MGTCRPRPARSGFTGKVSRKRCGGWIYRGTHRPDLPHPWFGCRWEPRLSINLCHVLQRSHRLVRGVCVCGSTLNGRVRGQVLLNGTQLDQTDNSAPFRHHLKGQKGKNTVDARVISGTGEGRWVFNFSGAPNFVPGSLAVESGQVISRGSARIVFRVGPSGAPIRFRYRLSR